MKKGIHPEYREVIFLDAAVNFMFLTRSTVKSNEKMKWEDGKDITCEDLAVMFAGSDRSDDRDSVITLLHANINTIDAAYLRKEAQTAGVFEQLKEAWAKVKEQQQQAPKE